MDSTSSVIRFVVIMTAGVAFSLALLSVSWGGQIKANEAVFNKRAILGAVSSYLSEDPKLMSDGQIDELFASKVEQIALDMSGAVLNETDIVDAGYKGGKPENIDLAKEKKKPEAQRIFPLYIFNSEKGKSYILSVRGNGLWDEIWGNIALKDDLTTIAGATFDHKGETPGLGAEIKDNPTFPSRFRGKKIFNDAGVYTSVEVKKTGGTANNPYAVDGISGATVTADGVEEMLQRGIKYYLPYLNKQAGAKKTKG